MDALKRFNSRGQEGLTLTTLLLIVLGVVVVVVIILGATGAFDFIFSKTDTLPGQSLEAAVQSCRSADSLKLGTDFCVNLKKVEIDGRTQYVTCNTLANAPQGYLVKKDLVNFEVGCGELKPNGKVFCESQKLSADTLVDDEKCSTWKSIP